MDAQPKLIYQTSVLLQTLMDLAHVPPERIVVHTVEGLREEACQWLNDFGINREIVPPFDVQNRFCNKLAQLTSPILRDTDVVILCDCDIAFAENIERYVRGDVFQAKIVDLSNPPIELWRKIFLEADFTGDFRKARTTCSDEITYANNYNGGLYVIPQSIFKSLGDVWPRWCRWLLNRNDLLGKFYAHADQVSLGLALRELRIDGNELPIQLNFPTHIRSLPPSLKSVRPHVLHYHSEFDQQGLLKKIGLTQADDRSGPQFSDSALRWNLPV